MKDGVGIKERIGAWLSERARGIKTEYGIGRAAAAGLIALKLLLFYGLVGTGAYFVPSWLLSCFFMFLLFSAFRNKWIPAVIYFLMSVLMFADVTYNSFFNRYLSVNMIGAAGMVGAVGASIREILRPVFFLMPADAFLILALLAFAAYRRRGRPSQRQCDESAADEGAVIVVEVDGAPRARRGAAERRAAGSEWVDADYYADTDAHFGSRRVKKKGKENKAYELMLSWVARVRLSPVAERKAMIALPLSVLVAALNPFGVSVSTALSNTEFVAYHVGDALAGVFGARESASDFAAFIESDDYASEKDVPLFGAAAGRNLIVIQMESFQNFVIGLEYGGEEVTPNLNALIGENTLYFDNVFCQVGGGNTSDAEFAMNNSFFGTTEPYTYEMYNANLFRGLPVLLREKGYHTAVFHAHEDRDFWTRERMYPAQGFDRYYGGLTGRGGDYEMTEWMGWGLTDTRFFDRTLPLIEALPRPFYGFVITLSNHHPYEMLEKYKFIDLLPEDENTQMGKYLQSVAYTDYAIGRFLDGLRADGLYEDSLIVLYGDHQGLPQNPENFKSSARILGRSYDFDLMMNVPLIVSLPGAETDIRGVVHKTGGQTDILPTVACLMGFERLDTLYLGHNLLAAGDGFAAIQAYMVKGSFFDDAVGFEMSRDGVFENGRAWNRRTGEPARTEDCRAGRERAAALIDASESILRGDLIRERYGDG